MTAISQRARPFTFAQVVGQEHVKDVLQAALQRGRVGHAYLLSGPRGVGKTTTARLLAMAVNCEAADPKQKPCGQCESCQLVRGGRHPDVIELDAASNNSVDDVRDLREKVRLAAMRGGKRVWVLDEAHMLSRAASNALLKTLEEPPENLVFILATTEPEKLPATILSRTQHFRFRRLSEAEIRGKLARLCREQDALADEDALSLVARAADGAMRDAESLLERLLTSGEPIRRSGVEAALGLPSQERLESLARRLAEGDLGGVFAEALGLYQDGFAPSSLASHLIRTFRDALYAQVTEQPDAFRLELTEADLLRLIHALDDEEERFGKRDDLFALEVALIKAHNALTHNLPREAVSSVQDFDPHAKSQGAPKRSLPVGKQAPSAPSEAQVAAPPQSQSAATVSWHKVMTEANSQLKAFLRPAQDEISDQTIRLRYDERHKFHFSELKKRLDELSSLISGLYGGGYELVIEGPGESVRKKF